MPCVYSLTGVKGNVMIVMQIRSLHGGSQGHRARRDHPVRGAAAMGPKQHEQCACMCRLLQDCLRGPAVPRLQHASLQEKVQGIKQTSQSRVLNISKAQTQA